VKTVVVRVLRAGQVEGRTVIVTRTYVSVVSDLVVEGNLLGPV